MNEPKEIIHVGALELRFLLDGDDTDQRMVVFEFSVPPGAHVPAPHYHEAVDELVYGLSGTMTTTVGGLPRTIGPGEQCFIARGVVHHHANLGAETATLLTVLTPATIGPAYFRELSTLLQTGGPPDPARVQAIMARHGLVVA
ncbi:cupin domain-containing protein [Hymenobacter terricola]|uniref:cupin domain-containing protein n=1 Tax=Hymenobacter terricola TaxID=2819236 RepID=UPI001B30343A|nr:cupin domain-containing protein [Hymenobacter terricola]